MRFGYRGAASSFSRPVATEGASAIPVRSSGASARRPSFVFGAALLIGIGSVAASTPAAAFLEFLFGGGQQAPAPAPYYSRTPLDISVRPKRAVRGHVDRGHKHKRELGRRHASPPSRGSEPKHVASEQPSDKSRKAGRQQSINPDTHPDWFLTDPNIRYGDILILKSGPVVYQGGSHRTRSREDFVSLGQSRTLSSSGLRDIRMMVSGVWTPPPEDGAAPAPGGKKRRIRR